MTKLAVMLLLTVLGVGGALLGSPFYAVAVYYFYAVFRPQWYWRWDLPVDLPWSFYVALAAMGATFVWRMGVWLAPHKRWSVPLPSFNTGHFSMMAFAFWIWVTFYTAGNQAVAYPFFEEYVKIFIMYFVAAMVTTSVRQIWVLYLVVTLTLVFISVEMNIIYFFQGGYTYLYKRGYGGLDNNGAALLLAMGLPLTMYAWDGIRHWIRWGFLLAVPIIIHAVLTSYSRGAMLALIVTCPLYMLRFRHKKMLAVILLGVAMMIPILAGKEIQDRFFSISESEQDGSAQSRFKSWAIAWQMASERPLFGFGIRNSNLYTLAYGADIEGRTIHSQYLQIAADSGMMGMVLYLLTLITGAICLWKVRRRVQGYVGSVGKVIQSMGSFLLPKVRMPDRPGHSGPDAERAYTMACGLECSMAVFCFGAIFLSLENFELPFLLLLMCAQLAAVFPPVAANASTGDVV